MKTKWQNIGNICPTLYDWNRKEAKWTENYKIDGINTQIKRLRKGTN